MLAAGEIDLRVKSNRPFSAGLKQPIVASTQEAGEM